MADKKKCPKCGYVDTESLLYCPNCGTELEDCPEDENIQEVAVIESESIFCHKCGAKNLATDTYCESCGAKLHKDDDEDVVRCPKCGSTQVEFVTKTEGEAFDSGGACCGWLLCGIPGLIIGGKGNQKQVTVKKCKKCGHEF